MSKQEWHIFGFCLLPGLLWGSLGLFIARYILGFTQASRIYEMEIASISIVVGMTFGVPSYAVNWLRRRCPKFTQIRDHLLESIKCVSYGIYCASLGFLVMGLAGLFIGQVIGVLLALTAPFMGLMVAIYTVIPASLPMRPLVNVMLEHWYSEQIQKNALTPKS